MADQLITLSESEAFIYWDRKYIIRIIGAKYETLFLNVTAAGLLVFEGPWPGHKGVPYTMSKPVFINSFQVCVVHVTYKHMLNNIGLTFIFHSRNVTEFVSTSSIFHHILFESKQYGLFFAQRSLKVLQPSSASMNISIQSMTLTDTFDSRAHCFFGGVAIYEFNSNNTQISEFKPTCTNITQDNPDNMENFDLDSSHDFISQKAAQYVVVVFYAYSAFVSLKVTVHIGQTPCVGFVITFSFALLFHVTINMRDTGKEDTSQTKVTHNRHVCGGKQ